MSILSASAYNEGCICLLPIDIRKHKISPESEVTGGYEPPCGWQDSNPGLTTEQQAIDHVAISESQKSTK